MAYSTITKPSDYFKSVQYTGNGSTQSITGVGFQPDFTWIKNRSATQHHQVFDSTRGATYRIYPASNAAQDQGTDTLTSFDSDGFSLGANSGVNGNTNTILSWNWLCNGGTTSSNTDGSITSTVQVNSTSGFSIVKYTGTGSAATVGHGLGSTPDLIFSKHYSSSGDWNIYHESFALNERIKLNSTGAKNTNTSIFAALPTSTTISVGTGGDINTSGGTHLFYCFKSVKGFSKIATYYGLQANDNTYVYCGFKPALVFMTKNLADPTNWVGHDNVMATYNQNNTILNLNETNTGDTNTGYGVDFLSNGFKWRGSNNNLNKLDTYMFAAFAENPLVANVSGGLPTTAR